MHLLNSDPHSSPAEYYLSSFPLPQLHHSITFPNHLADGSILRAAVLIIQNNLITLGSSNTRNWKVWADMVAQGLSLNGTFLTWTGRVYSTLKVWPSKLLLLLLFNHDPDASVVLADQACFVNGSLKGRCCGSTPGTSQAVAAAVASADAWKHGGTFPWLSMCAMNTDSLP